MFEQRSSTGQPPKYLTPTDVRAIPAAQWETWVQAKHIPWDEFAPDENTYQVAFNIAKATIRRLDARKRG